VVDPEEPGLHAGGGGSSTGAGGGIVRGLGANDWLRIGRESYAPRTAANATDADWVDPEEFTAAEEAATGEQVAGSSCPPPNGSTTVGPSCPYPCTSPDYVPNPNREGNWGKMDGPDRGNGPTYREYWRVDEGTPGKPGWRGVDHVHHYDGEDHMDPETPFDPNAPYP